MHTFNKICVFSTAAQQNSQFLCTKLNKFAIFVIRSIKLTILLLIKLAFFYLIKKVRFFMPNWWNLYFFQNCTTTFAIYQHLINSNSLYFCTQSVKFAVLPDPLNQSNLQLWQTRQNLQFFCTWLTKFTIFFIDWQNLLFYSSDWQS